MKLKKSGRAKTFQTLISRQIFCGGNETERISLAYFLFDILHVLIDGFSLYFW